MGSAPLSETTPRHSLSVAVIGAGAAGLVAARELRREGHHVTVFEQNSTIGGVWKYQESTEEDDLLGQDPNRLRVHSSMYASVRTNLPREIMSFADFPLIPEAMRGRSTDPRRFCHHTEVQTFLEVFADEFGITDLVQLQRKVLSIAPLAAASGQQNGNSGLAEAGPRWAVTTQATDDLGDSPGPSTQDFDAVVSCIGNYFQPNVPDIKGLAEFPGRKLHCHNYRSNESFRGETVLVVGASFSGDEIARQISDAAALVYQTARSWAAAECKQPRSNLKRLSWLQELRADGSAQFLGGEQIQLDTIVFCTGYRYQYDFLDGLFLLTTDDMRVSPLYKHIFPPAVAPTLSFIGLLWKSLRFSQFELQAKLVARVLSGRVRLPPRAEMEADIAAFYKLLEESNVPVRYTHNQTDAMPINQWHYNDDLTEMCGPDVPKLPQWRRDLHSAQSNSIFGRPDTFRDDWTEDEQAAFALANEACQQLLHQHLKRQQFGKGD